MVADSAVTSAQPPSPPNNPPLTAGCGLPVALVLDESASINTTSGATAATRTAANAFVSALENTGSSVKLTSFSITARNGPFAAFTEVNSDTRGQFTNWINGTATNGSPGYNPAGGGAIGSTSGTNWQAGLLSAQGAVGGPPKLMVFVTDGDPNTVTNANGTTTTNTNAAGVTNATNAAIAAANNTVKAQGTRVFVIGVGSAVNNAASRDRIQSISGGTAFTGTNFTTSDYSVVSSFTGLEDQLRSIVADLCGSTLTVTKEVSNPDGGWEAKEGWKFTATLHPSPGHTWVEPADAGTHPSATQRTDADGIARFEWKLETAVRKVTLGVIHEASQPDFHFVLAQCTTVSPTGETTEDSTTEIPGADLGADEFRTCVVYNRSPEGGDGGVSPDCTDCGDVAALPDLKVHKEMPARARVGDHVPITIVVHNAGHGTANDVHVHETPPDGGHIVAVGDHGSIQADGTVIWHIATLAPGETRTVHATMLVTRTGLLLNTAVDDAENGDPGVDVVPERVRPAAPAPPPPIVTG